jgi:hypothetical protein
MGRKGSGSGSDAFDAEAFVQRAMDDFRRRTGLGAEESKSTTANRSKTDPVAAARVAAYIRDNGLTQGLFAAKAKVGERTVHRLLHDSTASPRTWGEVAKAIGTTAEELLSGDRH